MQCARCHDHKLDPIRQADYYHLEATLFGYVEVDHALTTPAEAAGYEQKITAIDARTKPLREQIRRIEQPYRDTLLPEKYKEFPENVQIAIRTVLRQYAGQPLTSKGEAVVRQGNPGPLMPSPFQFRKYGQSGIEVAEIFPKAAEHVDELAVLRSVHGSSNDHVQAHYLMATGTVRMGFPSVGSWVTTVSAPKIRICRRSP